MNELITDAKIALQKAAEYRTIDCDGEGKVGRVLYYLLYALAASGIAIAQRMQFRTCPVCDFSVDYCQERREITDRRES